MLWLTLLPGCQQDVANPQAAAQLRELSAREQALVVSVNDFSLDLFREMALHTTSRNLFVSPFSIHMALSMSLNGADSSTLQAMRQSLHYEELEKLEINKAFNELTPFLRQVDDKVKFSLANMMWVDQSLNIQPLFRDMMIAYYGASVESLDFGSRKANRTINRWVEQQPGR